MAEKVDPSSGILGPTFLHMIADQFARLKEGDRYFYENGGQVGSFTAGWLNFRASNEFRSHISGFSTDQLNEIRKTSLAAVFCLNSDGIKNIQPLTFRPMSEV
jgi:peroxidase